MIRAALIAACLAVAGPHTVPAQAQTPDRETDGSAAQEPTGDLDSLMALVLANHSVDWDQLYDYVFDEVEALRFEGTGIAAISSYEHEYTWYVRDGYLVRSPVRVNGVEIAEATRIEEEDDWLRRIRSGEPTERIERDSFFDFGFEPGSYYFAGRRLVDGRELVEIEYYPTRSYSIDAARDESEGPPAWKRDLLFGAPLLGNQAGRAKAERVIGRAAVITLLVDPKEQRILHATIESAGVEGLPSWLVKVEGVRASMQMHRPLEEVWLPQQVSVAGTLVTARQSIDVVYSRVFRNYRRVEVGGEVKFGRPKRKR